ncbi:glycosyltransferase family 4 protein [Spirochaeta isovalerica]|uniref:UDP-GlcNAc:undecaprenyl-phosphate GlcNAc-1-phosphate transferase n=1 Tax=Spirochaeta isovalerica TaxID=150 RepID=A0A841R8C0_9SPIO|nr:MraY family glycosyltransferase [Spirochaeta isovalerica]MBB6480133.1 UDP-GlcNAc:undecaprenyl-phosphate GlcNAc-1-phosphate transferase [Spirochaeta isovalerica]
MNNSIILLIGIATSFAFLINLYLTPILIFLSRRHGLFDEIDHRKIHTEDTSRLGGIGIFTSFMISAFVSPFLVRMLTKDSFIFVMGKINIPLLILSIAIIFTTGILDDFAQVRARYKLVGQVLASIVAVLAGALITQIEIPFINYTIQLGFFSVPLTILWLVGLSNALNMIDGLDGLSSGIGIIASMIFGFVFLINGQFISAIISYSLVGALFGYLFFNFPPARIFMGDSGSLLIGFLLALLPIATSPDSPSSLVLPITMLIIPIFDVVAAIWRRSREKRNIFSPDRHHIHHKLLDMGMKNRTILAIVYGLSLILGIVIIIFESTGSHNFFLVLSSWLVVAILFIVLHYKQK